MKALHLINNDTKGGAAKACMRISKAINAAGIQSRVLVQDKFTEDAEAAVIGSGIIGGLLKFLRKSLDWSFNRFLTAPGRDRFSVPIFGANIINNSWIRESDVIILHWINDGFISIKSLEKIFELRKPLVWVLHDMWAFTGGCHYSVGCDKYLTECGNCPSLKFSSGKDLSNYIFKRKAKFYPQANIEIVTCSKWLSGIAESSFLLKNKNIRVIQNPINHNIFKPLDKKICRNKLKLDDNKIYILFAAFTVSEVRKGFEYLKKSLGELHKISNNLSREIELLVLGRASEEFEEGIPFKVNRLGRIAGDNNLAEIYNAADIFVIPSVEDNLPNTVLEALACGTFPVAFNIGGMPDMIDHKLNGYLAEPFNVDDFADGIYWFIKKNDEDKNRIRLSGREKILNNFTPEIVGQKYAEFLYSLK